jgi:hypothetical protein
MSIRTQQKAAEINVPVKDFMTWYDYPCVLNINKSGDAVRQLTERDTWILSTLQFLTKHIVHAKCRQAININMKLTARQPELMESSDSENLVE